MTAPTPPARRDRRAVNSKSINSSVAPNTRTLDLQGPYRPALRGRAPSGACVPGLAVAGR